MSICIQQQFAQLPPGGMQSAMSEAKFLKLCGDTVSSVSAFARDAAAFVQFEDEMLNEGIFKIPPATAKAWQELVMRLHKGPIVVRLH
jgi:hypothetical protein